MLKRNLVVVPFLVTLAALLCSNTSLAQQDLGAKVRDVFVRRCAECHGSQANPSSKSYRFVSSIDDLAKLRDNLAADGKPYKRRIVDRESPADSDILAAVIGVIADMPQDKDGNYVPLPKEESETIAQWFAAGLPLPSEGPADEKPARPPFVDEEAWLDAISKDLSSLPPADRQQARYFTMGHLYNAGAGEAALEAQRRALTKLLNSLSWNPRIARLHVFGPGNSLARVLLRELDWDPAKWELLRSVSNNYFVRHGLEEEVEIERMTGTRIFAVRSDWFVFIVAQPPLYHDFLAPRDKPAALDSDVALERYLGVDTGANFREGQIARAGFIGGQLKGGSGVSDNNRVIERHALERWRGAYWKSYDFAGNADAKNIFERPFGPKSLLDASSELAPRAFEADGGELIWNLPNGLQGYLLVNANGKRIDTGPQEIVKDPGEFGGLGTTIVNGISCMACHTVGMRTQSDGIRAHVEKLTPTAFTRGERQVAQRLYPPAEAFQRLLAEDQIRFVDAAKLAGAHELDAQQREPVEAVFRKFRTDTLKLDQAAFELGLAPEQFAQMLGGELASLRAQLETGIPRGQFLESFRALAAAMRLELVIQPKPGAGAANTALDLDPSQRLKNLLNSQYSNTAELLDLVANPRVRINGEALWLAALYVSLDKAPVFEAMLRRADVDVNQLTRNQESALHGALPPFGGSHASGDVNERVALAWLTHPKADPLLLDLAPIDAFRESPSAKLVRLQEELKSAREELTRSRVQTSFHRIRLPVIERRLEQLRRIEAAMAELRARR